MCDEDFARKRKIMVDSQLVPRRICDKRVLDAMRTVPRHRFVADHMQAFAYEDRPLGIGCDQTISQPYMVAIMTELLDLKPDDKVLEIGTGSGYQAAVLSCLVSHVVTVERFSELAESAKERLDALGYDNIEVIVGDGTLGMPLKGPYDAILVTAGSPDVPVALKEQLSDGGRLLCPVGSRASQILVKLEKHGKRFRESDSTPCIFVPLIGEQGW